MKKLHYLNGVSKVKLTFPTNPLQIYKWLNNLYIFINQRDNSISFLMQVFCRMCCECGSMVDKCL